MPRIKSTLVSKEMLKCGVTCGPQYQSGIDVLTADVSIPVIHVHKRGLDVDVLRRSLQATLANYPLIAGQLKTDDKGYKYYIGNDVGVEFEVRKCQGPTPDYGPTHKMSDHLSSYYKQIWPWHRYGKDEGIANFTIYQFDDGGAILSMRMLHSLLDGMSFWQFMKDWASAAQGTPTPPRSMDRQLIIDLGQANINLPYTKGYTYRPPFLEWLRIFGTLGWQYLTGLSKEVYRVPASTVAQWKTQAQAEGGDAATASPSELVSMHVMRTLSPVWNNQADRYLGTVYDLRYKRSLRIPRYFFGNALGTRDVIYPRKELETASLAQLAIKSRTSSEGLETDDLKAFLGLMEKGRQEKNVKRLVMRAAARSIEGGFVLNNCSHFPIYDIDFGTGPADWHEPIGVVFRMLMVITTPAQDGGFDLHFSGLKAEHAVLAQQFPTNTRQK
jgi:shikimate O-hydroxycinnamoyltransferase